MTRRSEHGMALISVLWILVLLGLIAASFAVSMRLRTTDTIAAQETAKARWLADAAVERGLLDLLAPAEGQTVPRDGRPVFLQLEETRLTIRIWDETGKLDLNVAPAELLTPLFRSLELEDEAGFPIDAAALSAAILDWRDRNQEARPLGAETPVYQDLGAPQLPRNGPLPSILELGSIRGMTPALYDQIAPYVTTIGASRKVNPAAAPLEVLYALPGAVRTEMDQVIAAREANASLPRLSNVGLWITQRQGPGFLIEGTAELPSGARYQRRVLVWIEGYGVGTPIPYIVERRPGSWIERDE